MLSTYSDIYYSLNGGDLTPVSIPEYGTWRGNYIGAYNMLALINQNGTLVTTPYSSSHSNVAVVNGTNTVSLTSAQSNKWISLNWSWGANSGSKQLSSIYLIFGDGATKTIAAAVTDGYIEPLVTYISFDTSRENSPYVLTDPSVLLTGGSQTQEYSNLRVNCRITTKSSLTRVRFTTNGSWPTTWNDGFGVYATDAVNFTL